MTDPSILAVRREHAFSKAARILSVDTPVPSTKAHPVHREAYLSELIVALCERLETLEAATAAVLADLEAADDTEDLTEDLAEQDK